METWSARGGLIDRFLDFISGSGWTEDILDEIVVENILFGERELSPRIVEGLVKLNKMCFPQEGLKVRPDGAFQPRWPALAVAPLTAEEAISWGRQTALVPIEDINDQVFDNERVSIRARSHTVLRIAERDGTATPVKAMERVVGRQSRWLEIRTVPDAVVVAKSAFNDHWGPPESSAETYLADDKGFVRVPARPASLRLGQPSNSQRLDVRVLDPQSFDALADVTIRG